MLETKRVYEPPSPDDGMRVLVDRLWPRGLSKENARLDDWMREIAPTDKLRHWFSHRDDRWEEFKRRYFEELDGRTDLVGKLMREAKGGKVTLLFSTKAEKNNAVALKEYIERRL